MMLLLCSLTCSFLCIARSNGFLFEKYLDTRLYEVIQSYSNNRPTLVFCASRNGVRMAAEQLVKDSYQRNNTTYNNYSNPNHRSTPVARGFLYDPQAIQECTTAATRIKDNRLAECIRHGVGYHSAAATSSDRSILERLFGQGYLPILCTTTTLAMGVNLPAHLVVIKSTQAWRGSGSGYSEYPSSTLLQMIGRAGRPQFDTSGVAVIMTSTSTAPIYRSLAAGSEPVESSLRSSLIEHLAAEVCLGTVTSLSTARLWIRSTFLASRMMANPRHYNLPVGADQSTIYNALDTLLANCLYSLHIHRCIQMNHMPLLISTNNPKSVGKFYNPTAANQIAQLCQQLPDPTNIVVSNDSSTDEDTTTTNSSSSTTIVPTTSSSPSSNNSSSLSSLELSLQPLGPAFVMIRHYISFDTLALFPTINRDADVPIALVTLCKAKEIVSSLTIRRDEKKILREIKERAGRMKVRAGKEGTVSTVEDKAFQLAQVYLGRLKLDTLAQDTANRNNNNTSAAAGGSVFHLRIEISHTADMLHRIARAFMAWCNCTEVRSPLYPIASGLSRGFDQQLWPDTIAEQGHQLLQLQGITETILPSFINGLHCTTLADLQATNITAANINIACRKMNDYGSRIKAQALALLPRLGLEVEQNGTDTEGSGAALLTINIIELSQHHLANDTAVGGTAAQRAITDYMNTGSSNTTNDDSRTTTATSKNGNKKLKDSTATTNNNKATKGKGTSKAKSTANNLSTTTVTTASTTTSTKPLANIDTFDDELFQSDTLTLRNHNQDDDILQDNEDTIGKRKRGTTYSSPAADTKLANNHKYTLVVTTIDKIGGLIYHRTNIRHPCTIQVRVPRPVGGPVIQVHLLHTTIIGMDMRITFKPVYPFSSRYNTTSLLTENMDSHQPSSSSSSSSNVTTGIVPDELMDHHTLSTTLTVPTNTTTTTIKPITLPTLASNPSAIEIHDSDDEELKQIFQHAEEEGEKAVQLFRQNRINTMKSYLDNITTSSTSIDNDIADLLDVMDHTSPIKEGNHSTIDGNIPPTDNKSEIVMDIVVPNNTNNTVVEIISSSTPIITSSSTSNIPIEINESNNSKTEILLDQVLSSSTEVNPAIASTTKSSSTLSSLRIPSGFESVEEAKQYTNTLIPNRPSVVSSLESNNDDERLARLARAKEQQAELRQRLGMPTEGNNSISNNNINNKSNTSATTDTTTKVTAVSKSMTTKKNNITHNNEELALLLQGWDDIRNSTTTNDNSTNSINSNNQQGTLLATSMNSKIHIHSSNTTPNEPLVPPLPPINMDTTSTTINKIKVGPLVSSTTTKTNAAIISSVPTIPKLRIPSHLLQNCGSTNTTIRPTGTSLTSSSDFDALLLESNYIPISATTTSNHNPSISNNNVALGIVSPPAGVPTSECNKPISTIADIDHTAATAGRIQIADITTRSYQPPPKQAPTIRSKNNATSTATSPVIPTHDLIQQFSYQPSNNVNPTIPMAPSSSNTTKGSSSSPPRILSTKRTSSSVATSNVRESIALLKEKVAKLNTTNLNTSFRSTASNSSSLLSTTLSSPRTADMHNTSFISINSLSGDDNMDNTNEPNNLMNQVSQPNSTLISSSLPSSSTVSMINPNLSSIMEAGFADHNHPISTMPSTNNTLSAIQQNEIFPYQRLRTNPVATMIPAEPSTVSRTALGTLANFPTQTNKNSTGTTTNNNNITTSNTIGLGKVTKSSITSNMNSSYSRPILSASALRLRTASTRHDNEISQTIDKVIQNPNPSSINPGSTTMINNNHHSQYPMVNSTVPQQPPPPYYPSGNTPGYPMMYSYPAPYSYNPPPPYYPYPVPNASSNYGNHYQGNGEHSSNYYPPVPSSTSSTVNMNYPPPANIGSTYPPYTSYSTYPPTSVPPFPYPQSSSSIPVTMNPTFSSSIPSSSSYPMYHFTRHESPEPNANTIGDINQPNHGNHTPTTK